MSSLTSSKEKPKQDKAKKVKAKKVRNLTYTAKVQTASGVERTEKLKAESRSRARMALVSQGLNVLELNERQHWTELEIGSGISASQLLQFTRQMAAFTYAGITVTNALDILQRSSKNKSLKRVLLSMSNDIRDGDTLAGTVRAHSKHFPSYYPAILEASERSGDLPAAFETLSLYLDRDLSSKRAVRSAMYYPTILVVLGISAMFIMTTVVLPRFQVFFASLNANLPAPTRALMAVASFMSAWWATVLVGLLAIVVAIFFIARTRRGRYLLDTLLLRMPVFGALLELIALERFTRVIGTLTAAGVPLPDVMHLGARVVGNRVYGDAILKIRKGILNGEGMSEPMEATKKFPEALVQVVRVGEQTGRLSQQLDQSAGMYAKEVDYRLKNLTSLLEPVVLLIVGGGVGFVAIALVSAMYGIYNTGNLS